MRPLNDAFDVTFTAPVTTGVSPPNPGLVPDPCFDHLLIFERDSEIQSQPAGRSVSAVRLHGTGNTEDCGLGGGWLKGASCGAQALQAVEVGIEGVRFSQANDQVIPLSIKARTQAELPPGAENVIARAIPAWPGWL